MKIVATVFVFVLWAARRPSFGTLAEDPERVRNKYCLAKKICCFAFVSSAPAVLRLCAGSRSEVTTENTSSHTRSNWIDTAGKAAKGHLIGDAIFERARQMG
jgi:hypothetical protein